MYKINTCKLAIAIMFLISFSTLLCAQSSQTEQSFLNKARKIQTEDDNTPAYTPSNLISDGNNNAISSSTLSLIRTEKAVTVEEVSEPEYPPTRSIETESIVNTDKPAASSSVKSPQFKKEAPTKKKPGSDIKWIDSSTRNLTIKVEPHTSGIMTPNLAMKFDMVHQVLRRNLPWLMSGKAEVYVYEDRASFLKNEPVASGWSGAFFSPDEERIVMYDEPQNTDKMISQFTHELTHLFVENFYNPPSDKYKLEPPIWFNEGLAVNMEDISSSSKGGVWASDLVVINILSHGDKLAILSRVRNGQGLSEAEKRAAAANMVSTKTVSFINFSDFVKNSSYDIADRKGDVENWYFQAYAMVRFLFRSKNSDYPDKRMQFEQFTKLMKNFEDKKDAKGNVMRDITGKIIKKRMSTEAALRKAYGFRDMKDFETRFWKWLVQMQKEERQKLTR